jgi:predicted SpoU family rRNA methylase
VKSVDEAVAKCAMDCLVVVRGDDVRLMKFAAFNDWVRTQPKAFAEQLAAAIDKVCADEHAEFADGGLRPDPNDTRRWVVFIAEPPRAKMAYAPGALS